MSISDNIMSGGHLNLAYDFIESTGKNLFLTGRAGTGKTTFLKGLQNSVPKRMIVVAPTGVAAINAGGVTMHSFFQLPFGIFVPGRARPDGEFRRFSRVKTAIIRSLDLLVIDEISMVRADTLDNVDEVLRRFRDRSKPFGGVQLLMIGDVQQLSPVVREDEWSVLRNHYNSPYFFDSQALTQTSYTSIELRKIYRQSDPTFIDLLARVRENNVDNQTLISLNRRHNQEFDPPQSEGYITLTSHNHTARRINDAKLAAIEQSEHAYSADIQGDFPEHLYPTDAQLRLKTGAQVMFTKNDPSPEKRFVNGTIGTIVRLADDEIEVAISENSSQKHSENDSQKRFENEVENASVNSQKNSSIIVRRLEWENTKYTLDDTTNSIVEQREGVFRQFPLRTAWAITIHKSQGLTFDRVIIDAADSFTHGQVYVALSRSRTLEGLVLRTPLRRESFVGDATVEHFAQYVEQNQPGTRDLEASRREYHKKLLLELFDFKDITRSWRTTGRLMDEHLSGIYPSLTRRWSEAGAALIKEVEEVGRKFQIYIMQRDNNLNDSALEQKIASGARYFSEHLKPLEPLLDEASIVGVDNKETRKRLTELLSQTSKNVSLAQATLGSAFEKFTVRGYLETRGAAIAAAETGKIGRISNSENGKTSKTGQIGSPENSTKSKNNKSEKARRNGYSDDIRNPEIFELLRSWRLECAREQDVPAYVVATQKVIVEISNRLPSTTRELREIKGVGPKFIEKYGTQILSLLRDYAMGSLIDE